MKDINIYKNRFYSLLESELGNVKPIISEAGPYNPNDDQLDAQPTQTATTQTATAATPTQTATTQTATAATPTQTATTQSNQTKTPYNKTEVIKMQDALKALKLNDVNPGTSDGRIGPNTLGAVSKLIQKYNELKKPSETAAPQQPTNTPSK